MELFHQNRPLYDILRKKWIKQTEEELVRQALLKKMIEELGFPRSLLAVERELSTLFPHRPLPQRRADIVSFRKEGETLLPFLLVECKKKMVKEEALRQLVGYNFYLEAPFICLASRQELLTGIWDQKKKNYHFFSGLPSFQSLKDMVNGS